MTVEYKTKAVQFGKLIILEKKTNNEHLPPLLRGCLSRILIFYPSRIPDPGSRISDPESRFQNSNKREGWKKIYCHTFFSHKFHKTDNYFVLELPEKKIWANFQRIIELIMQKIVNKLSKIWFWDPGSGKNLFRIPDLGPGVKKAPGPGSGSATLSSSVHKADFDSVVDSDPEPPGSWSGKIVPDPDLSLLTRNVVLFLHIFFKMA